MSIHSDIKKIPDHARVFLRVDANVPLVDGEIQSNFRLNAIKPTLDELVNKYATILFATHIGRPKGYDPALSTRHLLPWFSQHGYEAHYAATFEEAQARSKNNKPMIIVFENLRFFSGEKDQNIEFAQKLAQLADFYVNDAFAALHRQDTSITLLPKLFSPEHKMIGLLIQSEMFHLKKLLNKPRKGYTLMLGGGKLETKIPLIQAMLKKVDTLILCPAIVFTFLKAQGKDIGLSLVDTNHIDTCKKIIAQAETYGTHVVYPLDYQVAQDSFDGPLSYTSDDIIPSNSMGISIGPRSVKFFSEIIEKSSTIFYNGLMGSHSHPQSLKSQQGIFNAIAASSSYSIVAGGDSVAMIEKADLSNHISYLSSGGGATLAFLAGESLPGIVALSK